MGLNINNLQGAAMKAVETALNDAGQVGGQAVGGLAGEVAQVTEGLIKQFAGGAAAGGAEGFGVLKNAGEGLLGLGDNAGFASQGAGGAQGAAQAGAAGGLQEGGGSIFDKLFALLAKLQDQLGQKMDAASKIDPSNQAGLQKAMFEVQQIQSQMQELVTTATNLLKTQHDTQMSVARNFA